MIGPQVAARGAVNQLRGDPHTVGDLAHAAFDRISHPQFLAHLLHSYCPALVGEAGVASDDHQLRQLGKRRNDVLGHTVGEVLLLRVAGHVDERQDRERRFIWGHQGPPAPDLATRDFDSILTRNVRTGSTMFLTC